MIKPPSLYTLADVFRLVHIESECAKIILLTLSSEMIINKFLDLCESGYTEEESWDLLSSIYSSEYISHIKENFDPIYITVNTNLSSGNNKKYMVKQRGINDLIVGPEIEDNDLLKFILDSLKERVHPCRVWLITRIKESISYSKQNKKWTNDNLIELKSHLGELFFQLGII